MIPLTPSGVVPVGMAGALLRTLLIAGVVWVIANLLPRGSFRASLYSLVVLCGIVMAGAVSWMTGMKLLACRS